MLLYQEIYGDIETASGLILPGVGSFPVAMKNLRKYDLVKTLNKQKEKKTSILGICLGMQILFQKGFEVEETQGLGYLEGNINLIKTNKKLPHMGWNQLFFNQKNDILKKVSNKDDVYFVHSYMADFINEEVIAYTKYGNTKIPAIVGKENVIRMSIPSREKWGYRRTYFKSLEGDDFLNVINTSN